MMGEKNYIKLQVSDLLIFSLAVIDTNRRVKRKKLKCSLNCCIKKEALEPLNYSGLKTGVGFKLRYLEDRNANLTSGER